MSSKPDGITQTIRTAGEGVNKVQDFVGALSGDGSAILGIGTDILLNKLDGGNGVLSQFKNTAMNHPGLSLAITTARTLAGDPFATLEFGYKMIQFLSNEGFNSTITVPKNVRMKSSSTIAKRAQRSIQKIDTSGAKADNHEVSFGLEGLIDEPEFLLEFEGLGYEQLKAFLEDFQSQCNNASFEAKRNLVNKQFLTDKQAIFDLYAPLIEDAKAFKYDPSGMLELLKNQLDLAYDERQAIVGPYYDQIETLKEERSTLRSSIGSLKEDISVSKSLLDGASRENRSELFAEIKEANETKSYCYDRLSEISLELNPLYEFVNNSENTAFVDLDIARIKEQRKELKQQYVDQLYSQRTNKIEELNSVKAAELDKIHRLQCYVKQSITTIRNTVIKRKNCNWVTCISEYQGGHRKFDLNFGQLEHFIKKGFNEQESCQTCIDYKKSVITRAENDELYVVCNGFKLSGSTDSEQQPCKLQTRKNLTQNHVIGMPKIKGEKPYLFDGTDDFKCSQCSKKQSEVDSQVPFVDLPERVQELIDNYLDKQGIKPLKGDANKDLPRIQSRFYYSVMYDIITSTVVNTGISISDSVIIEANNANYDASYYAVTPQRAGSTESAALHLLKHMLNLGEQCDIFNNWSPGINSGGHDQLTLRTILGQPEFTHTNPHSTVPRQVNGVVDQVNYPYSLDTITPEATTFLQTGLDKLKVIGSNLQDFDLVDSSGSGAGSKKAVMNPFVELKYVYKSGKLISAYYMNNETEIKHNQKFKDLVSQHLNTWYAQAQVYYGLGGAGYSVNKKGENLRLDFVTLSVSNLVSSPNLGWINPQNQEWNL
jgi:transposase-like protein